MIRLRPSKFSGYKYRLMAPYALAFVMVAGVGYQLTTNLRAEELTSGDIVLKTDRQVYRVGENVRFTITNSSPATVSVGNDCPEEPLDVYREVGGQWQRLHDSATDAGKCLNEPRRYAVAADGGTASASYQYWPSLFGEAGRYRLVAPLAGSAERPEAIITVVGGGQ